MERYGREDFQSMITNFQESNVQSSALQFPKSHAEGRVLQQRARGPRPNQIPSSSAETLTQKVRDICSISQSRFQQNSELRKRLLMQHSMAGNRGHAQQRTNMNPYTGGMTGAMFSHTQAGRSGIAGSNPSMYQPMGVGSVPPGSYAAMFPHQTVIPSVSSTLPMCNTSNTVQISQHSQQNYANISFRKLPFYKVKHQVLRPIILNANTHSSLPPTVRTSATQEFQISFILTCDMASEIAMHRDVTKNEFVVQAQIRITAIDTNVTSGAHGEYDDFLPLGLVIRVNNRQCTTLPACSPTTRQGVETRRIPRPINITQLLKLSPISSNLLTINWASETGKTFVLSLNIVEKLSSQFLLNKLKEKPTISVDVTKQHIRAQYKRVIDDDDDAGESANADDDDIATTIVRVSLQCPLAKFRMMIPAKGKNCSHLQCFDGSAYICLNEKKPMWMCPVCSRPLYYDDLLVDQYFLDVLRDDQLIDDCQEVQLFVDGSWKCYAEESTDEQRNPKHESASSPSPNHAVSAPGSEDIADDVDRKDIPMTTATADSGNNADPVVDLTCEDEDSPDEGNAADNNKEKTNSNVCAAESRENGSNLMDTFPNSGNDTSTNASPFGVTTNKNSVISLDSPSPSPPPSFSSSPAPTALAALNIGKS